MPIVIDCPFCERKLRVPDDLMGQKVKCPTCGTTFEAAPRPVSAPEPALAPSSAPSPTPPPPTPEQGAPPAPSSPTEHTAGLTTQDTAPRPETPAIGATQVCPFCGETISKNATRCRYCEEDLTSEGEDDEEEDDRPWEHGHPAMVRRDCDPHRGGLVLTLGIVGLVTSVIGAPCYGIGALVGIPISLTALVMGWSDQKRMKLGEMDPMGQGQTQGGWICGLIGLILGILVILGWACMIIYMVFFFRAVAKMTPPPGPVPGPPPAPITKPMQPVNPPQVQQQDKAAPVIPDKVPPGKVPPPAPGKVPSPPKNPAGAPKDKVQAP
jgi:predicted Zn finger-like uncharacterized protein